MTSTIRYLLALLLWPMTYQAVAQTADVTAGTKIMQEVQKRHLLGTSIYEELTLILTDRLGNRDTRNLRRYMRMDAEGNARFLILFDSPDDVRGVALLIQRDTSGNTLQKVYLPASGRAEMQQIDSGPDGYIIGSDFSLEQMLGEQPAQYQYVLAGREKIGDINYYLVDVYTPGTNITVSPPLRRHYVNEDTFYISRTDYLDPRGRLLKQKTLYDLKQTGPESWRAGMVLMDNPAEGHRSLLKINSMIIADEFVPDEVFTEDWLFLNQSPVNLTRSAAIEQEDDLADPVIEDPRQIIIGPEVH